MRRVNCVWAILLNLRVKARLSSSIKIDRIMITSRKISGSRSNRGGGGRSLIRIDTNVWARALRFSGVNFCLLGGKFCLAL